MHLSGVSCPTASSCIAVGHYDVVGPNSDPSYDAQYGLIETGTETGGHWTWVAQNAPETNLSPPLLVQPVSGSEFDLTAVSCGTVTSCTAVGSYTYGTDSSDGGGVGVVETGTESGGSWTWSPKALDTSGLNPPIYAYSTPNESSLGNSGLTGVSCTDSICAIIGSYFALNSAQSAQIREPILLTAVGGALTVHSVPDNHVKPAPIGAVGDAAPQLSGVSCPWVDTCVAVGAYEDPSFNLDALVETGTLTNGTWTWTDSNATVPTTATPNYKLLDVSCPSATSCIATGQQVNTDVIESGTLSGNTWTWVVDKPATTGAFLNGAHISCPLTDECVIAGGWVPAQLETGVLTGDTWTWSTTTAPSAGLDPVENATNPSLQLTSISCLSTTCVSMGNYFDANSAYQGVIEAGSLGPEPPTIDSVTPTGPLDGGNTVVIDGTGFEDPGLTQPEVEFVPEAGDTGDPTIAGTDVKVVSDTEITVTAPDAAPDAVDATYYDTNAEVSFDDAGTTVDAVDATPGDSGYLYGGPSISSVSPAAGPLAGGSTVTVTGSGFSKAGLTLDKAEFDPADDPDGSTAITALDPVIVSDTELTLTVPDATAAADGKPTLASVVRVMFNNADDASIQTSSVAAGDSDYNYGAPVIGSVSPPAGPLAGGNQVTVTGSGFQDSGFDLDKVTFDTTGAGALPIDGVAASVLSDTEIKVTAPDATAAAAGKTTLSAVVGVDFTDPADAGAQVSAVVATTGAGDYTFGAPVIDSVSPVAGSLAGTDTVSIFGSGFKDSGLTLDTVAFDPTTTAAALAGVDASVVSDTEITVTAPDATAAADGKSTLDSTVKVTFTDPKDANASIAALPSVAGADRYRFGVPVIDQVTPAAGPLTGGTTVTLTGSGFQDSGLTLDGLTFDPGGTAAALDGLDATVVSDTEITVTTPDATEAADGKATLATQIQVKFTDPSDPGVPVLAAYSTSADNHYTFGAPVIGLVSPQAGPLAGGDTVTITGSGFEDSGLTFDKVGFVPTGGGATVDAADATVVSDTEITVTTPDATAAADGKAVLDTSLEVGFTDPADPGTTIKASAETAGSGLLDYTFGAPLIDSISPAAGPLTGGNTLTITGSGFENAALSLDNVDFTPVAGAGAAEPLKGVDATVVSDTELTVTLPDATAAAAGASTLATLIGVSFTDSQSPGEPVPAVPGPGESVVDYTFGAPVVDSITPAAGPLAGGSTVTITGSGFQESALTLDEVAFDPTGDTNGSSAIDGIDATVVSDTEITVTTPDATAAAAGKATLDATIDVVFDDTVSPGTTVRASAASANQSILDYSFGVPVIDSISPGAGPLAGGDTVTITGSGFSSPDLTFDKVAFDPTGDTNGSTTIDGVDATVVSDTEITVTTPDATADADGKSTLTTYLQVFFDDAADPGVPVQASVATVGSGIVDYNFGFPVIDSVSPADGPVTGGNTVTITGSGFSDSGLTLDKVDFQPTGTDGSTTPIEAARFTVVSDTEITVTAPDATASAAGHGSVETLVNAVFSDPAEPDTPIPADDAEEGASHYVFGAPMIDSVDPTAGPLAGGNAVTITGSGFEDSGLTFDKVTFDPSGAGSPLDGIDATVVSDTEITVTAPDATGASGSAATLSSTVKASFTVDGDPAPSFDAATSSDGSARYDFGAPQIQSVDPTTGNQHGGQVVTITGQDFENPKLVLSSVEFVPTDGTSAPVKGIDPQVVSDTTITVTTPDLSTEAAGAVSLPTDVTVNFEDPGAPGSPVPAAVAANGEDAFSFDAPTISGISPDRGPLAGGNQITVTGAGFEDLGLTFGGLTFTPSGSDGAVPLDATDVTVVSDTEITATVPDGTSAAAGTAEFISTVEADFTDPTQADAAVTSVPSEVNDNLYGFGVPTVDSISPATGPFHGGDQVTLTGSGFSTSGLHLDEVDFDTTGPVATLVGIDPQVVSDTEITVTVPNATAEGAAVSSLAAEVTAVFSDGSVGAEKVPSIPGAAGDDVFTYADPTVTGVAPGAGPLAGGNELTVTGTGFTDLGLRDPTVTFAPSAGSGAGGTLDGSGVTVVSDTELTVVAPDATTAAGSTKELDTSVTVEFADPSDPQNPVTALAATTGADDYLFGPPTIESVGPRAGPVAGGNELTVTGLGFEGSGLTLTGVSFDVGGTPGSPVTLDGVSPHVVSDTELTVTAPDATGAAGGAAVLDATVTLEFADAAEPDQAVTSAVVGDGNSYEFGAPVIDSVTPATGPLAGGDQLTIAGSGFDNPGLDLSSVSFQPTGDSTPADALDGVDASVVSDTEITVTAPDATAAADGKGFLDTTVDVTFGETGGGTTVPAIDGTEGSSAFVFGAPVIDGVSPGVGPLAGGDELTVTGTGFENPDLTFRGVTFVPAGAGPQVRRAHVVGGGLEGVDATVVSDTEITVTAPDATAAAGGGSTFDTTVTADFSPTGEPATQVDSSPAAPGDADYSFGQPIVDSVAPDAGPLVGGDQITITGSGFTNPDLTFSGVAFVTGGGAAGVLDGVDPVVVSDTQITVTTPDSTGAAAGDSSIKSHVIVQFTDSAAGDAPVDDVVGPTGSDTFTFTALPGPPTAVRAAAAVGSATVTWSPPETDGNDPLVSYTVTAVPGGATTTVAGTVDSAVVSGLDVGAAYYFTVSARNALGSGPSADSNRVVPTSTPVVDSTTGSGSVPGGTVATSTVTAAGGATLSITAQGTGTVDAGSYVTDPVAQLGDGTSFFDVSLGSGSSFTTASFTICGVTAGASITWWNPDTSAWEPVSDQGVPSGTPLCTVVVVDAHTSPSLAQLYGTVLAVTEPSGYWVATADGGVTAHGNARPYGGAAGLALAAPVVGMAPTGDGGGYWLVASDGGVFAYGGARFLGSLGARHLNAPVVGMAPTRDGGGYWLVAADGGVFAFGDARFAGSLGGQSLNAPVVGMTATRDGGGYWLVAADGGVFAYGDARFRGSAATERLSAPVVGIAATPDGGGYRLVADDGGVFDYGDAPFLGSAAGVRLAGPVVGIADTADGRGYWLVGADGGIFAYGDAPLDLPAAPIAYAAPVVGIAPA